MVPVIKARTLLVIMKHARDVHEADKMIFDAHVWRRRTPGKSYEIVEPINGTFKVGDIIWVWGIHGHGDRPGPREGEVVQQQALYRKPGPIVRHGLYGGAAHPGIRQHVEGVKFLIRNILIEAKVDDLVKVNPRFENEIRKLNTSDPSGKSKYLPWMVDRLTKDREAAEDILATVKNFHTNLQRLKEKDIGKYKTLDSLRDALGNLGATSKEKREESRGDYSKIYEDDRWLVVQPKSESSSCYWGKNTKWCISATKSENHFDTYTSQGALFFFVIDRQNPSKTPFSKIAIAVKLKNKKTFWEFFDAKDKKRSRLEIEKEIGQSFSDLMSKIESAIVEILQNMRGNIDTASDPNTSPEELAKLANHPDLSVRDAVAQNPATTSEVLSILVSRVSDVGRAGIAMNRLTSPKILDMLSSDSNVNTREGVARNPSTSPEILAKLADDPHVNVTIPVAGNPHTPPVALSKLLLSHRHKYVKSRAAMNPSTPLEVLIIALRRNTSLRRFIAQQDTSIISPKILDMLISDPDARVRESLAMSSHVPLKVLTRLSSDSDANVRKYAQLSISLRKIGGREN